MAAKSTLRLVYEAVCDLHAQEQVVTREALQEVTGLKLSIIDDRIATLIDEGEVLRRNRGVFVPAVQHPPARPISKTVMPDGMVKIEIGDEVLELTPREDRALAAIQSGTAVQFAAIEIGHETSALVATMRTRIAHLEAKVRKLEPDGQMALELPVRAG